MKQEEIKQKLVDMGYPDSTVFEDPSFDEACIGFSTDGRAVYSYDRMIDWLMKYDGMTWDDAMEYIEFNTLRSIPYAHCGPIVIYENEERTAECIANTTEET